MDELQTTPAPIYVTAPSPETAKMSGTEAVVMFGLGLVLMTLVVLALMAGVYQLFLNQAIASDPPLSALADSRPPPAEPHLQVTPSQELNAMQVSVFLSAYLQKTRSIPLLPVTPSSSTSATSLLGS